jgi:hypothetical protein
MRKLEVADVLALDDYLRVRDDLRARVRQARADRRVELGELLSLTFENRETVLFQVEEMIRVEQIRDPAKIAEEVAIYNDLVADDDELRATFFVEISERSRIKEDLDSLVGLEKEGLYLLIDSVRVPAEFEPGHAREDRISAVHFVRFRLTPEQRESIVAGRAALGLEIDHPAYRARTELGEATRRALAEDLSGSAVSGR